MAKRCPGTDFGLHHHLPRWPLLDDMAGAFAAGKAEAALPMSVELPNCALVTFPKNSKPYKVLKQYKRIQEHWSIVRLCG